MTSLKLLKEKAPLVICITNDVVKNFTANGLVALGASPAMSEYPADLEDLLKYAGGLLINIGTLTDNNWKLYQEALKIAEKYNVPAVLDPVACGAGEYRKKVADDLINNYKLAAIRGNAGEIASLVGINVASKGVDSAGVDNIDEIALAANKKFNIPIVVTGEVDAIAVNGEVVTIHNGSAMMPKVIGTGCLLGAVVASFIGLEKGQELKSLETAMLVYNIAGEMAEKRPNGHLPGTFKVEFINALYEITDEDVKEFKRVSKMFHKELLKLYFICGTTTCQGKDIYRVVEEALKGGITLFQFREKGEGALEGKEKVELAIKLQDLCKKYNVPFIVNDDIDLAMEIDADGVHVGQDDLGVDEIRKLMPDKIIGLSIKNEEEFQQSKVEYVDYVGVGPVFDTQSKDDAGGAIGYEGLKLMRKLLPQIPLVAIGGIQTQHIKDIMKTNVDGVSIISAISYAKNIEKTVREMSEQ